MADSEREILRERQRDEHLLGERTPFDSSRQATYEDTVPPTPHWDEGE